MGKSKKEKKEKKRRDRSLGEFDRQDSLMAMEKDMKE